MRRVCTRRRDYARCRIGRDPALSGEIGRRPCPSAVDSLRSVLFGPAGRERSEVSPGTRPPPKKRPLLRPEVGMSFHAQVGRWRPFMPPRGVGDVPCVLMARVGSGYEGGYTREREALLATYALCHVCRRSPADSADHQPPLALHVHVPDSGCCVLLPSCKPCQKRQGGLLAQALHGSPRKPHPPPPRPSRRW
jgi:hypothetical protein